MIKAFGIVMATPVVLTAGFMILACLSAVVLPAVLIGGSVYLLTRAAKGSYA